MDVDTYSGVPIALQMQRTAALSALQSLVIAAANGSSEPLLTDAAPCSNVGFGDFLRFDYPARENVWEELEWNSIRLITMSVTFAKL